MATIPIIQKKTGGVSYVNGILRVILGLVILGKGAFFLQDNSSFYGYISNAEMGFSHFMLLHLVVMSHLAGGLMIIFGVLTRFSVACQVPILIGALVFVAGNSGVNGDFFLALITLLLSIYVYATGGGGMSFDNYMNTHPDGETHNTYKNGNDLSL